MIEFIVSNLSTIIISAVLLLLIVIAIISMVKDKKKGKCLGGCAGCNGECRKCSK